MVRFEGERVRQRPILDDHYHHRGRAHAHALAREQTDGVENKVVSFTIRILSADVSGISLCLTKNYRAQDNIWPVKDSADTYEVTKDQVVTIHFGTDNPSDIPPTTFIYYPGLNPKVEIHTSCSIDILGNYGWFEILGYTDGAGNVCGDIYCEAQCIANLGSILGETYDPTMCIAEGNSDEATLLCEPLASVDRNCEGVNIWPLGQRPGGYNIGDYDACDAIGDNEEAEFSVYDEVTYTTTFSYVVYSSDGGRVSTTNLPWAGCSCATEVTSNVGPIIEYTTQLYAPTCAYGIQVKDNFPPAEKCRIYTTTYLGRVSLSKEDLVTSITLKSPTQECLFDVPGPDSELCGTPDDSYVFPIANDDTYTITKAEDISTNVMLIGPGTDQPANFEGAAEVTYIVGYDADGDGVYEYTFSGLDGDCANIPVVADDQTTTYVTLCPNGTLVFSPDDFQYLAEGEQAVLSATTSRTRSVALVPIGIRHSSPSPSLGLTVSLPTTMPSP